MAQLARATACGIRVPASSLGSYSTRGGTSACTVRITKAVAFEFAQREGEHALGDARDALLQLGESQPLAVERRNDQQGPLVGDAMSSARMALPWSPLIRHTSS